MVMRLIFSALLLLFGCLVAFRVPKLEERHDKTAKHYFQIAGTLCAALFLDSAGIGLFIGIWCCHCWRMV